MVYVGLVLADGLAAHQAVVPCRRQVNMIQAGISPEKINQQVRQVSHVGTYLVRERLLIHGTTKRALDDRRRDWLAEVSHWAPAIGRILADPGCREPFLLQGLYQLHRLGVPN